MSNKTIMRIIKANDSENKNECYMVIKEHVMLPDYEDIDINEYAYNYWVNSMDGYIHLIWLRRNEV